MASSPTDALVAGAEQFLAELTDQQFAALVKRVRAPQETDETPDAPAGGNDYPETWGFKGKEGDK